MNPPKNNDNDSLFYRKKHYSFNKSFKEKRNISPSLNHQNYSFSHQNNKPTNNNDNPKPEQNYSSLKENRMEGPMVFELLLKQKRKIQEELESERKLNEKLNLEISELRLKNQSLEKIASSNLNLEKEHGKKYRYLKEKFNSLVDRSSEYESDLSNYSQKINELNSIINELHADKNALRQKCMTKNKEFEALYREFSKYKEENDLKIIKFNAEIEKFTISLKEVENKYQKEREISRNLEKYNTKLLEENEFVIQEKMSFKSQIPELERKIQDFTQKLEYLEKELQKRDQLLAKKKTKSKALKSFLGELQSQLERSRTELIEIEEKNINLAEFIRKDIMSKSSLIDPSPTFKENSFIGNESKTLDKSFNTLKESGISLKDYASGNGQGVGYTDYFQKPRKYNKKYGKDAFDNRQLNLEEVKDKLSQIQTKKSLLEKKMRNVENQFDKF